MLAVQPPIAGGLTAAALWKIKRHNEPDGHTTSAPAHGPYCEQGVTERRCGDGKVCHQSAIVGIVDHEDREP
ncbi:hypothetical protein RQCS_60840 (plasmid) [Rhodococcus qingshengii]|nr:hypothetical protein RQCS_60840 [Rhodococcus qingshengii]